MEKTREEKIRWLNESTQEILKKIEESKNDMPKLVKKMKDQGLTEEEIEEIQASAAAKTIAV